MLGILVPGFLSSEIFLLQNEIEKKRGKREWQRRLVQRRINRIFIEPGYIHSRDGLFHSTVVKFR